MPEDPKKQQTIPTFNDIAAHFDPLMPEEDYDKLRQKYFNDFVLPRLARGVDATAAYGKFAEYTKRPDILTPAEKMLTRAGLFATSASKEILGPAAGLGIEPVNKLHKSISDDHAAMEAIAKREGIRPGLYSGPGAMVGMAIDWELLGPYVGAIPEAVATRALASQKAIEFASRVGRGSLTFGTLEAASDQEGNRLTAGLRGAAMGAIWEMPFALPGLLKSTGMSEKAASKILKDAMEGKPIPPEADKLLSKAISDAAQESRVQGRPAHVELNYNAPGLVIQGLAKDGKTVINIPVKPMKESIALTNVQSLIESGGAVDKIIAHPDNMNHFNAFMKTYASKFGIDDYQTIPRIMVKTQKAEEAASVLKKSGINTEVKASGAINIPTPVKPKPSTLEYGEADLVKAIEKMPDMRFAEDRRPPLGRSTAVKATNAITGIWNDTVPDSWKREHLRDVPEPARIFLPEKWQTIHKEIFQYKPTDLPDESGIYQPNELRPGKTPTNAEIEAKLDEVIGKIPEGASVTDPIVQRRAAVKDMLNRAWDASYKPGSMASTISILKRDYEELLPNELRATPAELEMAKAQGVHISTVDLNLLREVGVENIERARDVIKASAERASKTFFENNKPAQMGFPIPMGEIVKTLSFGKEGKPVKTGLAAVKQKPGFIRVELPRRIWNALYGREGQQAMAGGVEFESGDQLLRFLRERGVIFDSSLKQLDLQNPAYIFPQGHYAQATHWHEQMHTLVDNTIGLLHAAITDSTNRGTAMAIATRLMKDMKEVYGDLPLVNNLEEAYVHAATAIRFGDEVALGELAKWDTSVEHVRRMVEETSQKILDNLHNYGDGIQIRIAERRLSDMVRRSSPERMYHFRRSIDITGEIPHLDAEGNIVLKSPTGETRTFRNVNEMWDHLESSDNTEWLPNPTFKFEMRGFTPQFSPVRAVRDPATTPEAAIDYTKEKWAGLAAASGMWRPFLPWVATIDQKISGMLAQVSSKQKFPIYDLVRKVDDQVRLGDQWIINSRESYVNILKGVDTKRQYALFEVLTAKPGAPQEAMMKALSLTPEERAAIPKLESWMNNFREQTGLNVWNYLREDLPQLRAFNYDPRDVYGSLAKKPEEMSTWHRMIEEQKWDPRDTHLGRFVNMLIREGFTKKFTGPHLDELEKLVNLTAKKGDETRYFLGPMRWPLQNYVNYVRGYPDMSQQVINSVVGSFTNRLIDQFKQINKMLPAGIAKLPEKDIFPQQVVNRFMILSYAAGLGARPAIAVRDGMQAFMTALPVLGPAKFSKAFLKMFQGGYAAAEEAGALLTKTNIGELYGDIFRELPPDAGKSFGARLTKFSNAMLSPSRYGHNFGRAIAYIAEYDSAMEAIAKYRKGAYDAEGLIKNTSLWFNDKPRITQLLREAGDASVPVESVARKFALEVNDLTQWPYRRGTQPAYLRTGMGRIFGQYGMWPMNYFDFLMRMSKKVAQYPDKALPMLGIWSATNFAAVSAFEQMGADTGKWWFFSPSSPVPISSPHFQLLQAVSKSMENSQEGREARRTVLEYPIQFVPNSTEVKGILKAIEDEQSGKGESKDTILRALGMKPLPEMEKEKEWQEWLAWQAGLGGGRK